MSNLKVTSFLVWLCFFNPVASWHHLAHVIMGKEKDEPLSTIAILCVYEKREGLMNSPYLLVSKGDTTARFLLMCPVFSLLITSFFGNFHHHRCRHRCPKRYDEEGRDILFIVADTTGRFFYLWENELRDRTILSSYPPLWAFDIASFYLFSLDFAV